jgi:POT family proton-dependent oligopeptide transporter
MLQLGVGFLVVAASTRWAGADGLAPLAPLVLMYLLHTTGELCLSPIGLSVVGALAPRGRAGTAMGAWFLSFAFSSSLAASLAALTGAGGEGEDRVASAGAGLEPYARVFGTVGWLDVAVAIVVLLLARRLAARMHLAGGA